MSNPRNISLLVLLTAVVFFDILFLGRNLYLGDIAGYHYPMKKVVRELTLAEGLPQWNPWFMAGQPLAANPAYELFYPLQWLIYLPSYPWAFQFHIVIHVALAAIAMYLLLRSLDLSPRTSLFGAAAYAFGAVYLSLLTLLPFLFSMAWLPLTVMFARRVVRDGDRRAAALGAICFAMQAIIGEPTTVIMTVGLAVALSGRPGAKLRVAMLALMFAGGALIASIQIVPAIDHARDSIRAEGFVWLISSNWSTPPRRALELFFPQIFHTLPGEGGDRAMATMYAHRVDPYLASIYPGLLVTLLFVAGLVRGVKGRGLFLSIFIVSAVLAMGSFTPVYRWLYSLGLVSSIRFPEKFLLAAFFAMVVYAAVTFERLADDRALRKTVMTLAAIWLAISCLWWLIPPTAPPPARNWNYYWAPNVIRGVAVIALLMNVKRKWFVPVAVAFVMLDSSFVHWSSARRVGRDHFAEPPATSKADPNRSAYRIFHRGYWDDFYTQPTATQYLNVMTVDEMTARAMFPLRPAIYGFRMALDDDTDQTGLLTSTEFLRAARDVMLTRGWQPDFMRMANIRYVVEFIPRDPARDPGDIIWLHDIGFSPRYYFAGRVLPIRETADLARAVRDGTAQDGDAYVPVQSARLSAKANVNRVDETSSTVRLEVTAEGESFLIAAITGHKYWRATIDGREAKILPANVGFQGLFVSAGSHVIEMRYRNPLIIPCAIVSLLALLIAAFVSSRA